MVIRAAGDGGENIVSSCIRHIQIIIVICVVPFCEIPIATWNLKNANLTREAGFGSVYKAVICNQAFMLSCLLVNLYLFALCEFSSQDWKAKVNIPAADARYKTEVSFGVVRLGLGLSLLDAQQLNDLGEESTMLPL
ncbi:hypothetical protein L1987_49771 [Smallanthus sonchifolius]|uniref:Uncharacterized protein n=1 Tax=Smallanthus sonchifolius TaxID=185202 RepID=A0ACB9FVF3_9ASTR|nr:hypothetical protein L1987_49771 [Smallanthus sonchifolius]